MRGYEQRERVGGLGIIVDEVRLAMMAEELTEKVQRSTEKQRKKLQTQPLLQRPTIMA